MTVLRDFLLLSDGSFCRIYLYCLVDDMTHTSFYTLYLTRNAAR